MTEQLTCRTGLVSQRDRGQCDEQHEATQYIRHWWPERKGCAHFYVWTIYHEMTVDHEL